MLDVGLVERTMARVEAARIDPLPGKAWVQAAYRCHTGMCYAGHMIEEAGLEWAGVVGTGTQDWVIIPDDWTVALDGTELGTVHVQPSVRITAPLGSRIAPAGAVAELLMGHSSTVGVESVFSAGNGIEDLRRLTKKLIAEELGG